MKKSLVIVESPSKAKTLSKYLGKKYTVMASIGHVRDLPKSKFGVDVEHDFQPQYQVIRGKKKVLDEIKKAGKTADRIYLAPDPDREGEAIAWHIAEELNGAKGKVQRVLFHEITERAVKQAIEHPVPLDLHKVDAQQARRILDRIVGYTISPLLWEKVRRGLSAGRVQSVAVRIICERERAITAFQSVEYWSIAAMLEGNAPPAFDTKLFKWRGADVALASEAAAADVIRALQGVPYAVSQIEKKERRKNPPAPFTTSKLQQEASRKLRFSPKRTMALAQRLYEGVEVGSEGPVGLITYMRTDSTRISPDAQAETTAFVRERFGADYVPTTPNVFKNKKGAQDAHEAIRPTAVTRDPEQLKTLLERDLYNLYTMIWKRFVASQMTPAIMEQTRVDIVAGEGLFRATGAVVLFPGFTTLYTETAEPSPAGARAEEEQDEERRLPALAEGDRLRLHELLPRQHFTQPPPRFTESLLIKELEEQGIGRPSTYAAIISTIQDRKYVAKVEGRLRPTELGVVVNDLLVQHFPEVLNVQFTAHMEEDLDQIEEGNKPWVETVREFYGPFTTYLSKATSEMRNVKREERPTEIECERCHRKLVIKWGRNGRFLACPGYPECKNTKEFREDADGTIVVVPKETETSEVCEKCGSPMVIKTGRFGRFLACSGYPACKTTRSLGTGVTCPKPGCGGQLLEKRTKKGRIFYSCANYPKCDYALWERPLPKPCPQCHAPFVVQKTARGAEPRAHCIAEGCGYEEEEPAA
ncbi:MAG: DNA topoisomerase I [Nitrospirae bacterium RIFCSPHIGHO2_01_FULL_66_17]|nr:MAG: DNA topoisomerase I [Nitrospirae bacterium RIFCSPHIGHO2_01_FULL_66_17]